MSTTQSTELNILFADDEQESRDYFQELLTRLGHTVFTVSSGKELVEMGQQVNPDLIMTDILMPDGDGIEAVVQLSMHKNIPVILVSAHHDAELIARSNVDHIMSYLIKPVGEADVKAAIATSMARFGHFLKVREEADTLRQALEDRKKLERAKGIVMKRLRLEESDAFRRLQKLASDNNCKLVDIVQSVIDADRVFKDLERL